MDDVRDDAKGGGYRRIEVLTGPGRRRIWSDDDKARIVSETLQPGAVVTEVGGGLRSLTVDGRDLVVPFAATEPRRHYRGAVLAPWPNRTGDGRWSWRGAEQQLALTEPDRACALHGLVVWQPWDLLERSADSVTLTTRVWPQAGYPGLLSLAVTYRLVEEGPDAGLTWELEARNDGAEAAAKRLAAAGMQSRQAQALAEALNDIVFDKLQASGESAEFELTLCS